MQIHSPADGMYVQVVMLFSAHLVDARGVPLREHMAFVRHYQVVNQEWPASSLPHDLGMKHLVWEQVRYAQ